MQTDIDQADIPSDQRNIATAMLYRRYLLSVIGKNVDVLNGEVSTQPVLNSYCGFLRTLNELLLERKSTILGKEANLFTTNIDIFLEKAIDSVGFECNDGFGGRFRPKFDLSNFRKAHFRSSPHYDNISGIPTVNLLKLHGSLTWMIGEGQSILFCNDLAHVRELLELQITPDLLFEIGDNTTVRELLDACQNKQTDASISAFLDRYADLPIVNPNKAKFRQTVLNETYYELLRIYSNELEKENTVLFVMGFSFADEHIREITLRAASSNPTLLIQIYAHNNSSARNLEANLPRSSIRNENITIIPPPRDAEQRDAFQYDLATIDSKVFRDLLKEIRDSKE